MTVSVSSVGRVAHHVSGYVGFHLQGVSLDSSRPKSQSLGPATNTAAQIRSRRICLARQKNETRRLI